jgi:GNAT superfamily N-acetyltransferase
MMIHTLDREDPAQLDGFTRVRRACLPALLATPASVAHEAEFSAPEAHYRQLVAVDDTSEVIGTAQVGIAYDSPEPGQGFANVYVHPDHLGRGAGTQLLRTAEEHLAEHGARQVYCWVLDGAANLAWAAARGYTRSRSAHFLRLDLTPDALPPRQTPPPGVELRTGADFAADPRPLFDLDAAVMVDEPSDTPGALDDYEQWLEDTWRHPLLDHELTSVALVDGVPAAFSLARTDGQGRYMTGMTGTDRAFRGRGLAKLAKNDSLHRARAAGITVAYTGNDAENGPMLAINKWFGYVVDATEVRHVRTLGA